MSIKKYFRCKSIESLASEASHSHSLERTLGAWQLILLGIGAIIGAGIFVLTGTGAAHAGPAIVLSFALSGLACACAALCYAELASMIPIAGSSYTYSYATMGELPAWFIAGMITLTYGLGAAAVASGWSGYIQSFLTDYGIIVPLYLSDSMGTIVTDPETGREITTLIDLPALLIVLLLTWVVSLGAEASAKFNAIVVYIKTAVLLAFVAIGSTKVNPSNWTPFIPENTGEWGQYGFSGIIAGCGVVFLAYTGFDAVATAAQETKNPKRDLPIGIIGSLVISALFYIIISAVLTGVVSYKELNVAEPMAVAVNAMQLPWFSDVIKIGAIAGLTSVVLVLIFGIVRIIYTVTHDGLLPKFLAKVDKKRHSPLLLTYACGAIIAVFASVLPLGDLVKLANFGTLITFAMVCFGTLYLRIKRPEIKREFRCPMVPVVPIAGMLLFALILFGLPMQIFKYAGIWIAVLLVVYFGYSRHNSHLLNPKKVVKKAKK